MTDRIPSTEREGLAMKARTCCELRARLAGPGPPDREIACNFDLAGLMRLHKVTIRELSRRMGVTMKAIRQVRGQARVSYTTYCDYTEAVTGRCVFDLGRYRAIERQLEKAVR